MAITNRSKISRKVFHTHPPARVLNLRKAKKIVNNILFYGVVQSHSRPNKLSHTVLVKRKSRHSRARRFSCTCEAGSLGQSTNCRHIRAVRIKLARQGGAR